MLPTIKHPITKLTIPSTKQAMSFRPLLVKEEKILLMAKESGVPAEVLASIKQVVSNCASDKSFNLEKITIFDLEYLFLQLRAISIDNVVKLTYKDTEDNKEYDFDVDLTKITVEVPKDQKKLFAVGENVSIMMKWPSAAMYDDEKILEMSPQDAQDEILLRHIEKIISTEGAKEKATVPNEENREEVIEFINNLSIAAYNELQKFIEAVPKMEYEIKYTNSKGTERKMVLSSLSDFFILL